MPSAVSVLKSVPKRRSTIDVILPVFVQRGQPKTHWIWCTACHRHREVPIYRIKLCTPCYKKGGVWELQGVTETDRGKIANYVREECAGDFEDGASLG